MGDGTLSSGQVGELANYVLSDPPCSQEDGWVEHSHPAFKGITSINTKNLGQCK